MARASCTMGCSSTSGVLDPKVPATLVLTGTKSPNVAHRSSNFEQAETLHMSLFSNMVSIWFVFVIGVTLLATAESQLSTNFYDSRCPRAVATVSEAVRAAVARDRTLPPALLRLHFHDCFVRGCDASVLLDSRPGVQGEKEAFGNKGSLRGFELIDSVKTQVEALCPGVVSCSDILTLAARDAIQQFAGFNWSVPLGRRDGVISSVSEANNDLPPPSLNFDSLVSLFNRKGFTMKEMVTLSGSHTIGVAHCSNIQSRLYNFSQATPTDPSIESTFAASLKRQCKFGDTTTTIKMDQTTSRDTWDQNFYSNVLRGRALFQSDDATKRSPQALKIVQNYNKRGSPFNADFAAAMIRKRFSSRTPTTSRDWVRHFTAPFEGSRGGGERSFPSLYWPQSSHYSFDASARAVFSTASRCSQFVREAVIGRPKAQPPWVSADARTCISIHTRSLSLLIHGLDELRPILSAAAASMI
ncbi:hypothetical protein R1flu_016959 [Riccia fluitans]|uniref:peroxidase n=1 Tax=Riccia fluitans TaxID=41844 RepID=A0ABD1YNV6_9MARC